MTYKELYDWVLKTQFPYKQVILALEEHEEPSEVLEEVGKVCCLPFIAHTTEKHCMRIRGAVWPTENLYGIHVELWEDEKNQIPEQSYTWADLARWIGSLPNMDKDVRVIAGQHKCGLRFLKNDMLYAYKETT